MSTPEERFLREVFKRDLDKHTYEVILEKLREGGWGAQTSFESILDEFNDVPESFGREGNPVEWIETELSYRVKEDK